MEPRRLCVFGLFSFSLLTLFHKVAFAYRTAVEIRENKQNYIINSAVPSPLNEEGLSRYKRGLADVDPANRANGIPTTTVQTTPNGTVPKVPTPELPIPEVTTLKGTTSTMTQNKRQNIKGDKHKATKKPSKTKSHGGRNRSKKDLSGSA